MPYALFENESKLSRAFATASDVLKVIEHVRKTVAKKTGVTLELECKIIGT